MLNMLWKVQNPYLIIMQLFFHSPTTSALSGPDILLSAMVVSPKFAVLPKKD